MTILSKQEVVVLKEPKQQETTFLDESMVREVLFSERHKLVTQPEPRAKSSPQTKQFLKKLVLEAWNEMI